MHGSSLTYAWLSDGTKIAAKADDGSGHGVVKRYLGSFVYTTSGGFSTDVPADVESAAWDEGRIFLFPVEVSVSDDEIEAGRSLPGVRTRSRNLPDPQTSTGEIRVEIRDCWFAGDHLGNVRAIVDITSPDSPNILEHNDYLPFGTRIQNASHAFASYNRRRYAAKEEQYFGNLDLSLLDFGARMYDPFTARWTAVDPLANVCVPISPYVYCVSNPIIVRDSDGNIIETVLDAASLVMGIKSFVSNVKQGNVGAAIIDGIGIIADAAAVATPFVPGGVGAGIKAIRAGNKVANVVQNADRTSDVVKAIGVFDDVVDASKASAIATDTGRGLANEAKTLGKLGETKNTKSFTVTVDGKKVTTIPDINNSTQVGEIKDTKAVYNTNQIKAERKVAESQGKEFKIYTGNNTYVSKNIPQNEIVRLDWLGPQ